MTKIYQRSAIGDGACSKAAQGQVAALVRALSCSVKDSTNKPDTKTQRTSPSASSLTPWKNSRVLKALADMPKDFCTSLRAGIPVADCSVDTGRSAALWRKLRRLNRGTNSLASGLCNENLSKIAFD